MMRLILVSGLSIMITQSALANSCRRYGNQIYCDNGTRARVYGNTMYINTPRGKNSCRTYGGLTFCDNGVRCRTYEYGGTYCSR